jgi:DNA-binding transcriptional LysR family regulator
MDFHQLRYFLEVARKEHMGQSARVLGLSQSALSHAISSLEQDLGVTLFAREGRRIFLNSNGQFLLERGEKLLREKQSLEEEIRSYSGEMQGTIRLAAPIAINSYFLGPAWARLSSEHKLLKAEISSLRSIEIIPKVISGEIELGICFGLQAHPLIESSHLARKKLLIAVSRDHSSRKGNSKVDWVQYLNSIPASLPHGLLGFGHGESHPFFERHRIKPNVSLLYDNYQVAVEFISTKPAWALLPDWICDRHLRTIYQVRPKELFEHLEITAVWSKNRIHSPIAKLVENEMKASIQMPELDTAHNRC